MWIKLDSPTPGAMAGIPKPTRNPCECAEWLPISSVEEKKLHWEQPEAYAPFPARAEGKRNEHAESYL